MLKYLLILTLLTASAYGVLAGGRPNSISGGLNAFAGVVNPANAVWIDDRVDVGGYLIYQNSKRDQIHLTYRSHYLLSADFAVHKKVKFNTTECSFSLATYTTPTHTKLRTKRAIQGVGTTPIELFNQVKGTSAIFALKLNQQHSIGFSLDYFDFSHKRNGFQGADNALRSISPGHVTNNGIDHSYGFGLGLGWRWNISKNLSFGAAYVKKSYCGQYRKYRGFEPHHAENYIPQTFGAGFSFRLNEKFSGRLECLWTNLGNTPGANNNVLPNGQLNLNKRGSRKSPGPGLQDATLINAGLGYKWNKMLSFGLGLSHRIKLRSKNAVSHTYTGQTIYDFIAFGSNFKWEKHDAFLTAVYGLKNRETKYLMGGRRVVSEKRQATLSAAWGYLY